MIQLYWHPGIVCYRKISVFYTLPCLLKCNPFSVYYSARRLSRRTVRLASASYDESAMVWDTQTDLMSTTFQGHTAQVNGVAFSPDGTVCASISYDKTLKIWDANTSKELKSLAGHTSGGTTVDFSPDGKKIVTGEYGEQVLIWGLPASQ
jgi:WD40 repeat protein